MAFATKTPITTPDGTTSIEQLHHGSTVLAYTTNGILPKAVVFSDGTRGGYSKIIRLDFAGDTLGVTYNQPIVLADNKIKNAIHLRPGEDQLLKANGQTVQLDSMFSMTYEGDLYGFAIDTQDKSGDHLIIANGIVCGDFVIEIMPSDDSDGLPLLGEQDYKEEK